MENSKGQRKYQEWLDLGMVSIQEYETFERIMDECKPRNAQENRLAYLKFMYAIGDITKEQYEKSNHSERSS